MNDEIAQAVAELESLLGLDDPETVHGMADEILESAAPPEVREAYERVRADVGFWYA